MTPYEQLLDELARELPTLERKIFDALRAHPEGLRRAQLVAIAYGEMVRAGAPANNSTKDRKVRKAMRTRMIPIISSSGQAGYRLDVSRDARERMLADLRSRRDKLTDLINRAAKFYSLPERLPVEEIAQQPPLFERPRMGLP
jgi:hypothetical protein